jgi:hypothetical protein
MLDRVRPENGRLDSVIIGSMPVYLVLALQVVP